MMETTEMLNTQPLSQNETLLAGKVNWKKYFNRLLAAEISTVTKYYNRVVQLCPRKEDQGFLLSQVLAPERFSCDSIQDLPDYSKNQDERTAILLNGNFNHHFDIQELLQELSPKLGRNSRVMVVVYNSYVRALYVLANWLGVRRGELPSTFITENDLGNIATLSGFEVVKVRHTCYSPWSLFGLGQWMNRILPVVPFFRYLGIASVVTLRPIAPSSKKPSLTIVIPARNEKGNIENALKRMPNLGCDLEIVFVEGHSSDQTWEEIQRVMKAYGSQYKIKAFQQTGKGKSDAVRLGFSHATCDLMTILDADLTMPPELLGRFYEAYCQGLADFVNGTRLVYPMEGEAMRFLNRLGNIFFAKALSIVLGVRLGDSLCGTKLMTRHDYQRMIAWRNDFGDFDPFGDFELLFPAAILGLGIIDIPIRYRARTYGSTNISRFRHGFMLLRMTLIGFFRVQLGKTVK